MRKELVIDFKNDGTVTALHMDGFDLGFLGDKKVFRQTDIVFDSDTQKWDLVYLTDYGTEHYDSCLTGFPSYEVARGFEVAWINECRLMNIEPVSAEGLAAMRGLRDIAASQKPVGPANVLVKGVFGCARHKSVLG